MEKSDSKNDVSDIGKFAQEVYSHDDVESNITVKKDFKDTVLLWLLKGRFEKSSEFSETRPFRAGSCD